MTGGDFESTKGTVKLVGATGVSAYLQIRNIQKTSLENNTKKNIRELRQLETDATGNTTQKSITTKKGEINEQLKNLGFDVTIC
jgi:hypothetical protein